MFCDQKKNYCTIKNLAWDRKPMTSSLYSLKNALNCGMLVLIEYYDKENRHRGSEYYLENEE